MGCSGVLGSYGGLVSALVAVFLAIFGVFRAAQKCAARTGEWLSNLEHRSEASRSRSQSAPCMPVPVTATAAGAGVQAILNLTTRSDAAYASARTDGLSSKQACSQPVTVLAASSVSASASAAMLALGKGGATGVAVAAVGAQARAASTATASGGSSRSRLPYSGSASSSLKAPLGLSRCTIVEDAPYPPPNTQVVMELQEKTVRVGSRQLRYRGYRPSDRTVPSTLHALNAAAEHQARQGAARPQAERQVGLPPNAPALSAAGVKDQQTRQMTAPGAERLAAAYAAQLQALRMQQHQQQSRSQGQPCEPYQHAPAVAGQGMGMPGSGVPAPPVHSNGVDRPTHIVQHSVRCGSAAPLVVGVKGPATHHQQHLSLSIKVPWAEPGMLGGGSGGGRSNGGGGGGLLESLNDALSSGSGYMVVGAAVRPGCALVQLELIPLAPSSNRSPTGSGRHVPPQFLFGSGLGSVQGQDAAALAVELTRLINRAAGAVDNEAEEERVVVAIGGRPSFTVARGDGPGGWVPAPLALPDAAAASLPAVVRAGSAVSMRPFDAAVVLAPRAERGEGGAAPELEMTLTLVASGESSLGLGPQLATALLGCRLGSGGHGDAEGWHLVANTLGRSLPVKVRRVHSQANSPRPSSGLGMSTAQTESSAEGLFGCSYVPVETYVTLEVAVGGCHEAVEALSSRIAVLSVELWYGMHMVSQAPVMLVSDGSGLPYPDTINDAGSSPAQPAAPTAAAGVAAELSRLAAAAMLGGCWPLASEIELDEQGMDEMGFRQLVLDMGALELYASVCRAGPGAKAAAAAAVGQAEPEETETLERAPPLLPGSLDLSAQLAELLRPSGGGDSQEVRETMLTIGSNLLSYAVLRNMPYIACAVRDTLVALGCGLAEADAISAASAEAESHGFQDSAADPAAAAAIGAEAAASPVEEQGEQGLPVVHLAVLSNRLTVVRTVLVWAAAEGLGTDWVMRRHGGRSPLDLAAMAAAAGGAAGAAAAEIFELLRNAEDFLLQHQRDCDRSSDQRPTRRAGSLGLPADDRSSFDRRSASGARADQDDESTEGCGGSSGAKQLKLTEPTHKAEALGKRDGQQGKQEAGPALSLGDRPFWKVLLFGYGDRSVEHRFREFTEAHERQVARVWVPCMVTVMAAALLRQLRGVASDASEAPAAVLFAWPYCALLVALWSYPAWTVSRLRAWWQLCAIGRMSTKVLWTFGLMTVPYSMLLYTRMGVTLLTDTLLPSLCERMPGGWQALSLKLIDSLVHACFCYRYGLADSVVGAVGLAGFRLTIYLTCAIFAERHVRRRFEEAVRAGARLQKQAPRQDHGAMVQEYCEGGTLKDRITRSMVQGRRVYTEEQALSWLLDVAEALHFLHTTTPAQHIHRDIKAENVLLKREGTRTVAKLGDLGLHVRVENSRHVMLRRRGNPASVDGSAAFVAITPTPPASEAQHCMYTPTGDGADTAASEYGVGLYDEGGVAVPGEQGDGGRQSALCTMDEETIAAWAYADSNYCRSPSALAEPPPAFTGQERPPSPGPAAAELVEPLSLAQPQADAEAQAQTLVSAELSGTAAAAAAAALDREAGPCTPAAGASPAPSAAHPSVAQLESCLSDGDRLQPSPPTSVLAEAQAQAAASIAATTAAAVGCVAHALDVRPRPQEPEVTTEAKTSSAGNAQHCTVGASMAGSSAITHSTSCSGSGHRSSLEAAAGEAEGSGGRLTPVGAPAGPVASKPVPVPTPAGATHGCGGLESQASQGQVSGAEVKVTSGSPPLEPRVSLAAGVGPTAAEPARGADGSCPAPQPRTSLDHGSASGQVMSLSLFAHVSGAVAGAGAGAAAAASPVVGMGPSAGRFAPGSFTGGSAFAMACEGGLGPACDPSGISIASSLGMGLPMPPLQLPGITPTASAGAADGSVAAATAAGGGAAARSPAAAVLDGSLLAASGLTWEQVVHIQAQLQLHAAAANHLNPHAPSLHQPLHQHPLALLQSGPKEALQPFGSPSHLAPAGGLGSYMGAISLTLPLAPVLEAVGSGCTDASAGPAGHSDGATDVSAWPAGHSVGAGELCAVGSGAMTDAAAAATAAAAPSFSITASAGGGGGGGGGGSGRRASGGARSTRHSIDLSAALAAVGVRGLGQGAGAGPNHSTPLPLNRHPGTTADYGGPLFALGQAYDAATPLLLLGGQDKGPTSTGSQSNITPPSSTLALFSALGLVPGSIAAQAGQTGSGVLTTTEASGDGSSGLPKVTVLEAVSSEPPPRVASPPPPLASLFSAASEARAEEGRGGRRSPPPPPSASGGATDCGDGSAPPSTSGGRSGSGNGNGSGSGCGPSCADSGARGGEPPWAEAEEQPWPGVPVFARRSKSYSTPSDTAMASQQSEAGYMRPSDSTSGTPTLKPSESAVEGLAGYEPIRSPFAERASAGRVLTTTDPTGRVATQAAALGLRGAGSLPGHAPPQAPSGAARPRARQPPCRQASTPNNMASAGVRRPSPTVQLLTSSGPRTGPSPLWRDSNDPSLGPGAGPGGPRPGPLTSPVGTGPTGPTSRPPSAALIRTSSALRSHQGSLHRRMDGPGSVASPVSTTGAAAPVSGPLAYPGRAPPSRVNSLYIGVMREDSVVSLFSGSHAGSGGRVSTPGDGGTTAGGGSSCGGAAPVSLHASAGAVAVRGAVGVPRRPGSLTTTPGPLSRGVPSGSGAAYAPSQLCAPQEETASDVAGLTLEEGPEPAEPAPPPAAHAPTASYSRPRLFPGPDRGSSRPGSALLCSMGAPQVLAAHDRQMSAPLGRLAEGCGGCGEAMVVEVPRSDLRSLMRRVGSMTALLSPSGNGRLPEHEAFQWVYGLTGQAGSCMYMAPEVFYRQPYNEKCDVFSYGVLLYEMWNCELLLISYINTSRGARMGVKVPADYARKVAEGFRPPRPQRFSEAQWTLVCRCWHQDPCERPSMGEVGGELRAMLQAVQAAAQAKAPASAASGRHVFARAKSGSGTAPPTPTGADGARATLTPEPPQCGCGCVIS
ncbi:hypothetical protein HYH03_005440 [Edaphochlamys debaryana]|uniref:Protein kinase domain-containing protein n=1 Tax=Edaphochlamys debaryana TaxID=47281 RepID=A0A835Y7L9_9CHLO|nr:hypothetical protein HYH03_005440 [Edaphochlamys debaryana]|eukprot:KAG2496619.1 hypothetical protein HYH03_005440 [Edaphochlamys debaryana]